VLLRLVKDVAIALAAIVEDAASRATHVEKLGDVAFSIGVVLGLDVNLVPAERAS
jgi:hypothetical protein